MKQYIIVIVLVIVAIVAIIIRVSNRDSVSAPTASSTPVVTVPSSQTTTTVAPKPATTPTTVKPTVQARPTPTYTRGGTYVDTTQFTSASPDGSIRVTIPAKNAVVSSPVRVTGEAVGGWYFEGTFSAVIKDANNIVIGQAIVPANGTWMTSKMVPFDFTMSYSLQQSGTRGSIVLKKDNPSGLPQNDQSLIIPVIFK